MNLQRLVVSLALLMGLLGQHPLVTAALPSLRQLYTSPRRHELGPVWGRRLPFLLGYLYFQSGDYSKATLHFERARENYPELQDYTLWYLGEALLHLERTQ